MDTLVGTPDPAEEENEPEETWDETTQRFRRERKSALSGVAGVLSSTVREAGKLTKKAAK